MPERIGLLVGMENSFPPAFIERVNRDTSKTGVVAELAKIAETRAEDWKSPYRVLIDRISHHASASGFPMNRGLAPNG